MYSSSATRMRIIETYSLSKVIEVYETLIETTFARRYFRSTRKNGAYRK
jgi:hypothetical protein